MSTDKPVDGKENSDSTLPEKAAEIETNTGVDEAASDSTAQDSVEADNQSPVVNQKKKSKAGLWMFLLALVLIAAALGAGWYFAQQQAQLQQSEMNQLIDVRIADLNSTIEALRSELDQQSLRQQNVETTMVASVEETDAQLLSLANRISESESTESGDWVLAEAEYLLRIANQRLVTSQDISGAVEMMRAADDILRELAYPELTEVRRQLVSDLTRLNMIQPVDYEGLYFALDSLRPSVAALSVSNIERLEAGSVALDEAQGWKKYWGMVTRTLSPYIVVNSNADEPQYLVSDEQESLVKSQIQLDVRQAQLAMMSGRQSLYEAALTSAADQIDSVFGSESEALVLSQSIREMAQQSVANETVDINESIRALGQVIDQLTPTQSFGSDGSAQ